MGQVIGTRSFASRRAEGQAGQRPQTPGFSGLGSVNLILTGSIISGGQLLGGVDQPPEM
jgi:hypothetical protein